MGEQEAMLAARMRRQRVAKLAINALASTGPRFLFSQASNRTGQLMVDRYSQVWYVDAFTGLLLYPFGGHAWRGFSSGPGLKKIVQALAGYVRIGQRVDLALLDEVCVDAYGKDWPDVRAQLAGIEAFTETKVAKTENAHEGQPEAAGAQNADEAGRVAPRRKKAAGDRIRGPGA